MTPRHGPLARATVAAALAGCSVALDFGPGVLLPSLDGGRADAAEAAVDAPADLGCGDAPCGCERACTGATVCVAGECVRPRCEAPEVECGVMCADVRADARHCGACGVTCGPGAPRCCRGACTSAPRCP